MLRIFKRFFKEDKTAKVEPRMYLVLREDLAYKYIQGAHALAQFSNYHISKFTEWGNKYLICLSTFNGLTLQKEHEKIISVHIDLMLEHKVPNRKAGLYFEAFIEPDLRSTLPTAIAVYEDGRGIVQRTLSHLNLATK